MREFYRHFEESARRCNRFKVRFYPGIWEGEIPPKTKKNRRAGVTLQKKLMCTLKGEFLEIGFTTGAVQLHILVGEGNKTDKWY